MTACYLAALAASLAFAVGVHGVRVTPSALARGARSVAPGAARALSSRGGYGFKTPMRQGGYGFARKSPPKQEEPAAVEPKSPQWTGQELERRASRGFGMLSGGAASTGLFVSVFQEDASVTGGAPAAVAAPGFLLRTTQQSGTAGPWSAEELERRAAAGFGMLDGAACPRFRRATDDAPGAPAAAPGLRFLTGKDLLNLP